MSTDSIKAHPLAQSDLSIFPFGRIGIQDGGFILAMEEALFGNEANRRIYSSWNQSYFWQRLPWEFHSNKLESFGNLISIVKQVFLYGKFSTENSDLSRICRKMI